MAHHDLRHLVAMLAQCQPISLAPVPTTCVPSTFLGTGDGLLGSWLRLWQCWHSWNHRCDWINHWLCAMVVEVTIMVMVEVTIMVMVEVTIMVMVEVTIMVMVEVTIMVMVEVTIMVMVEVTIIVMVEVTIMVMVEISIMVMVEVTIMVMVEVTIMVMVEVTVMVMVEVTVMVMVEVTMVAKAMLSEELPQTSLGAVTMATEVMAFLMAALTFHEGLAFHEDLLHWFGAHMMAFTVSATLSVAFHGFLKLCLHMRAAGQLTLLMALMIMTTGLMTLHDWNSLTTSCLELHPEWFWTLFLTMHIITTFCMANSELGHDELRRRGLEVFNPFVEAMLVPLREIAAFVHKHLHWTIANLAATTIRTALLVALDNAS